MDRLMAHFGKNLRYLRESKGMTQLELVEKLGYNNQSTITKWEQGLAFPRLETAYKIAAIFGVGIKELTSEPLYVLGDQLGEYTTDDGSYDGGIPLFGNVAAGTPIFASSNVESLLKDTKYLNGDYYALRIKGQSMKPKMSDGDIVIVHHQTSVEDGDIAIVAVNGDEATCKKIKKHKNGLSLISLNPAYDAMFFTKDEVDTLPVTILGKVVELRAKI